MARMERLTRPYAKGPFPRVETGLLHWLKAENLALATAATGSIGGCFSYSHNR
jgi:hypothetical protein